MNEEFPADLLDTLPYRPVKPRNQLAPHNKSKFDHRKFVGWDGEGITDTDGHHYCLFANSLGTVEIGRPTVGTQRIFETLIAAKKANPKAIHVIYYGGYDFNKWLEDLPLSILDRLRNGEKAYWGQYNIDVRFGKRFWLKDRIDNTSITVWDVGSFFQQSFVKSLRDWQVPLPDGVLENIERQKQNRSVFSWNDLKEIRSYCQQELQGLVQLMTQFAEAVAACNIKLRAWHGPGALAEQFYKRHNVKAHKTIPPEDVNNAAQYAYGGGRIELVSFGHYAGPCYYSDVRSCYPFAISRLPSLAGSTWQLSSDPNPPTVEMSLYNISWDLPGGESFYPVRHRYTDGKVCYPQKGVGTWVWTPEYELVKEFYPGRYHVVSSLLFRPGVGSVENRQSIVRPFSWVEDYYQQRAEWKRQGKGEERILKLALNSLYGKMIQQLGWKAYKKLPAYHQLEWGGYVTSAARAMLYRAARTNPTAIIGFETDGILSTAPLAIPTSEALGGWEVDTYQTVTYVQNGFYWLGSGADEKVKYRGFDKGTVNRTDVLGHWAEHKPCIEATLTRFIGLRHAMHTGKMEQWGQWQTAPRLLDIHSASSKRQHVCSRTMCRGYGTTLAEKLHDTWPYGEGVDFSAPYPLEWKDKVPEWKLAEKAIDMELDDYIAGMWA